MAITTRSGKGSPLTHNEMDANLSAITEKTSATGAVKGSSGTTAQRPASPVEGYTRFNTTLNRHETYNGSTWITAVSSANTDTSDMSFVVDEDAMTSDSATKVPTQQSVKAYVDSQVQSKDALSELSGTLDDITDGTTYVKSTNDFTDANVTKLSGIETAATADQTDAEIKTAYENNADTNEFSDAEQTKLAAIESSATADQTNLEIKTAYEANTNTNAYTDTEVSKLSGIESSADVTDSTNVNAAGAVMESDTTTASMSFVVDQDDMAGDSATKIPTQQSVKAYVDSQVQSKDSLGELGGNLDDITDGTTYKRMSATEQSKLSGIESGATADQTNAQIKTAYEANADTNEFSDAEQTKLSGIEASATADQSASEIKTAYESNADTNEFSDAEQTKLSGIATSANNYSHPAAHTISEVTGLQTALDGKTTESYVDTEISNLVDSSPAALDTLNELAAALGDDANFSTTVTNSIATKLPKAGGTLTGNLSLGDNVKAQFGASDDLQIYHDGSNSYIKEEGVGDLYIKGTNIHIQHVDSAPDEHMAQFVANGTAKLYYDSSKKIETTSTGIDVTGSVTCDSLTVEDIGTNAVQFQRGVTQYLEISANSGGQSLLSTGGTNKAFVIGTTDSNDFRINTNNTERLRITSSGNVGIGTSSPGDTLEISKVSSNHGIKLTRTGTSSGSASLQVQSGGKLAITSGSDFAINTPSATDALVVKATTGNVGIGTSSPNSYWAAANNLVVNGSSDSGISIVSGSASTGGLVFADGTGSSENIVGAVRYDHSTNAMKFRVNSSEAIRIDSSGNVGIGTSSPGAKLEVNGSFSSNGITDTADNEVIQTDSSGLGGANYNQLIFQNEASPNNHYIISYGSSHSESQSLAIKNNSSSGDVFFSVGNTERMRITSAGNVGIGTSSPSTKLEVKSGYISQTDGTVTTYLGSDGTGSLLGTTTNHYQRFITNNTERMRIDSSGNVGIGASSGLNRLSLKDGSTNDGNNIASFDGSDTNQRFIIANYLCGSSEDRVGILWENQGTLNQRMWCDDTGDIRVQGGNPTAHNSGTVVGTQTFTGTHIYKSSDDTLITGEAVKLVERKLVRCIEPKDPACIGIFIGKSDKIVDSFEAPCSYDYWHDAILYTDEEELPEGVEINDVKTDGYFETINPSVGYPYAIASLGDTIANISGTKLEGVLVDCAVTAGDLLCTSVNGLLTKQDDDIIHSYTVAKVGEDGDSTSPVYAYIYCG